MRSDWSSIEHLFGVVPDQALAEHLRVTQAAVTSQRTARKIEPFVRQGTTVISIWYPIVAGLLFERYTDEEIAGFFDLDVDHVSGRRELYQIQHAE